MSGELVYDRDGIQLWHGDALAVLPNLDGIGAIVTDPPYGMKYRSGMKGRFGDCAINGDDSTELRDGVLAWGSYRQIPALVFGNWRVPRPTGTRTVLVWDKGPHVGMGDLSIPWKSNTEEVYVLGTGFKGRRGSSVLTFDAVSPNFHTSEPRRHPTQKPLALMMALVRKCPHGLILDPFVGSGTTLIAARKTGRRAIGIEIERRYIDVAVRRLTESETPLFAGMPEEQST